MATDSLFNLPPSRNQPDNCESRIQEVNPQPTYDEADSSDVSRRNQADLIHFMAGEDTVQSTIPTPVGIWTDLNLQFDDPFRNLQSPVFVVDEQTNLSQAARYQMFGFEDVDERTIANSKSFWSPDGLLRSNPTPALEPIIPHQPLISASGGRNCPSTIPSIRKLNSDNTKLDLEIPWSLFEEL
jgi:hypothetical protein